MSYGHRVKGYTGHFIAIYIMLEDWESTYAKALNSIGTYSYSSYQRVKHNGDVVELIMTIAHTCSNGKHEAHVSCMDKHMLTYDNRLYQSDNKIRHSLKPGHHIDDTHNRADTEFWYNTRNTRHQLITTHLNNHNNLVDITNIQQQMAKHTCWTCNLYTYNRDPEH
eukprot:1974528-Heterocapsa_arctica.AAC.1